MKRDFVEATTGFEPVNRGFAAITELHGPFGTDPHQHAPTDSASFRIAAHSAAHFPARDDTGRVVVR